MTCLANYIRLSQRWSEMLLSGPTLINLAQHPVVIAFLDLFSAESNSAGRGV